jgi:hypothetical protein
LPEQIDGFLKSRNEAGSGQARVALKPLFQRDLV